MSVNLFKFKPQTDISQTTRRSQVYLKKKKPQHRQTFKQVSYDICGVCSDLFTARKMILQNKKPGAAVFVRVICSF